MELLIYRNLMLAAMILGVGLYANRIRHPERSKWRSIVVFVALTFLIPPASAGLAYLSYLKGAEAFPDAVALFALLAIMGLWLLRRTIRRAPRRSRADTGAGTKAGVPSNDLV